MATPTGESEDELLQRTKKELEEPITYPINESSVDYYYQNKNELGKY